jgi:hypothetical protein
MPPQNYEREKNGIRLDLMGGMNLMLPPDLIQQAFAYLQNVRRNLAGRAVSRPALGSNILTSAIPIPTSLLRLNDPYIVGSPQYVYVIGAGMGLYVNAALVASGFSGLPLSFVTVRPNTSPQPWCYVADYMLNWAVTIPHYPAAIYGNNISGMVKVRSDGLVRKSGIAEPQSPPSVTLTSGPGPNWVIYRYVYRASETGALSNPSPESPAQVMLQDSVTGGPIPGDASNVQFTAGQYETVSGQTYIRTATVANGTLTDYVTVNNFGFSIPDNVTVNGVQVTLNWDGQNAGTGILVNVSLFFQGAQLGLFKSPGVQNSDAIPTDVTQGDSSDNWGTTLSPSVVNDPTFGFGVQIQAINSGSTNRSFLNSFTIQVFFTNQNSQVVATPSPDPQVTKIDFYRSDPGLENFTYVGTVPNGTAGLTDTLTDLAVANNQILQFDNFEPFPSIDLPRSGNVTVTAMILSVTGVAIVSGGSGQTPGTYNISSTGGGGTGAVVQIVIASSGILTTATVIAAGTNYTSTPTFPVSEGGTPGTLAAIVSPVNPAATNVTLTGGDPFNVRWLPGNLILLGSPSSPAQIAWTTYARPTSPTTLTVFSSIIDPVSGIPTFSYPPAGVNQTYEISEASLAAEPSPVIWGPTPDNQGSFYFGLDPLNPGDLLWSKGNNFDSAPDTNRMSVTSPSEVLMNGVVTSELSTVFSTDRFWLIYPNFADALATVIGTTGPQWTLIQAQATRGLYMRYAIAALGSTVAYRAKDCIVVSEGGGPDQSITDSIYNLFPHGGSIPQPVTIAGNTVFPPDDTNPNAQTITLTPEYLFYNYQDTSGTPRTLIFDFSAKGWSVDVYNPVVGCHLFAVGSPTQLLTGCVDGTVRLLGGGGIETGTSIIATRSENSGDARALKRVGDVFFKVEIQGSPVALQLWAAQFTQQMTGFSPTTLAGIGTPPYYIVDFTSGFASDVVDIGALLTWPVGSGSILDLWQPDWIYLPETVQDRPSDWDDSGVPGNKFVQGFLLECQTLAPSTIKTFQVESDDGVLHTPVEVPFAQSLQGVKSFTFNPPFTAHMMRIVSSDGIPWRFGPSGGWTLSWMVQPYPEASTSWTTEGSSLGLLGWNHIYQINLAYISTVPVTLTVNTDQGPFTLIYPATTTGSVLPSKILLKCPRNKWKVVSFSVTSTVAFPLWKDLTEVWVKSWGSTGEYQKLNPFGGDSTAAAQI